MSKLKSDWKTIAKRPLVQNTYVNLWEEQVEQPDGKTSTYYVNRLEPFSIVIPYHDGKIYMVRQYRYAINALTIEFPMGVVRGADPQTMAVRELKEETGISTAQLIEIGKFYVGAGRTDQPAHVFLASHLSFGEQELESGEFIEVESYTLAEVEKMIENGTIVDGPSIAAFHYLEAYIKNNSL